MQINYLEKIPNWHLFCLNPQHPYRIYVVNLRVQFLLLLFIVSSAVDTLHSKIYFAAKPCVRIQGNTIYWKIPHPINKDQFLPQESAKFNVTINDGLATFVSAKTNKTFFTCRINSDDSKDRQYTKAEQQFNAHLNTLHLRSKSHKDATYEALYEDIFGEDPLVHKQKALEKRSRENFLHRRSLFSSPHQKPRQ
jgi:hypothetical protein